MLHTEEQRAGRILYDSAMLTVLLIFFAEQPIPFGPASFSCYQTGSLPAIRLLPAAASGLEK